MTENSATLGPVHLAPGISRGNAWTLMYSAFFTIGLLTFVGVGTPYVMNVVLEIPISKQGVLSGNLVFWTEITTILLFGPIGIAADKYGRKSIYLLGFATMGIGYALYPTASSVNELIVYRVFYGIGIAMATGMLATILTDYPKEKSRGKLVGITGAMNGLGIVFVNRILGTMPERLVADGMSEIMAGRIVHWIVAGLCFVSVLVLWIGLKDGVPVKEENKPPLRELATSAFQQGTSNPRIFLAYCAAFIARGDLVIIGTFLTLWGTTVGIEQGISAAEATTKATLTFVLAQIAGLCWTFVVIFFIDKFNRTSFLCFCMAIATIGYMGMGFIDDPTTQEARPLVIILGIGQISAFFGSASLIGQEAPLAQRGSVLGGFNVMAAIGILVCSVVGGRIFDTVSPSSTFLLIGIINGFVFILALIVRLKSPGQMPEKSKNKIF